MVCRIKVCRQLFYCIYEIIQLNILSPGWVCFSVSSLILFILAHGCLLMFFAFVVVPPLYNVVVGFRRLRFGGFLVFFCFVGILLSTESNFLHHNILNFTIFFWSVYTVRCSIWSHTLPPSCLFEYTIEMLSVLTSLLVHI